MTQGQIAEISTSLLEALAYLRKASIIHRDIKPSNILLMADGTVRLCDFGLSRMLTPEENYPMTEHKDLFKRKAKDSVKKRRRSLSPEMQTYDYKAPEVLLN